MNQKQSETPSQLKNSNKAVLRANRRSHFGAGVDYVKIGIIAVGIMFAITIRVGLLDFKTLDFFASLKPWYTTIKSQGFSTFATDFSTYNPPYLYLLYLIARIFPDMPTVIAVKLPSLVADFITAYFVYLIAKLKYPNGLIPTTAGMAILFAPTVVLNSALWGQADSLFTVGLVACLFFLLKEEPGWSMFAFGIALAFKLQAIFLAPLLLALLLQGRIHWKYFLIVPAILLIALIPSWMAGRPILDLLNIYLYQTSQFESLTMNAPSLYAWLPSSKDVFILFYVPGVIMGAISAYLLFLIVYKSSSKLGQPSIMELTLLCILVIPFFLPKMHERYFYPADVISIAFAFYFPQFYFIPILIVGTSFFAYQPYLFNIEPIPMPILTGVLLLAICILTYHTIKTLYSIVPSSDANIVADVDGTAASDYITENV